LKIIINAVAAKMGAAQRHLTHIPPLLSALDPQNEYVIFVNPDTKLGSGLSSRIRAVRVRFGTKSLLHRLIWDQCVLPYTAARMRAEVIVSLLNFGPVAFRGRQINFQQNSLYFCESYLRGLHGRQKLFCLLQRKLLHWIMKSSQVVVTPTIAMKEMIRSFYPDLEERKVRVLPYGFDGEEFSEECREAPEGLSRISKETGADNQITKLLYVSHLYPYPYKGIDVLLQAFGYLREWGCRVKLVLTIERSDWPGHVEQYGKAMQKLEIERDVIMVGHVPQETVGAVYRSCDIFVYPSLCESFGLPMLEAMAAGLPTVAADTPVNREMLGDAALYYAPDDPKEAAKQMRTVIEDPLTRSQLSGNALKRVSGFDWSWQRYVRSLLGLLGAAPADAEQSSR